MTKKLLDALAVYAPWRDQAACLDQDPELFFPKQGNNDGAADAKDVCRECPVRLPCLEFAVERREAGVWGGTTDGDRSQVIRWWNRDRALALRNADRAVGIRPVRPRKKPDERMCNKGHPIVGKNARRSGHDRAGKPRFECGRCRDDRKRRYRREGKTS